MDKKIDWDDDTLYCLHPRAIGPTLVPLKDSTDWQCSLCGLRWSAVKNPKKSEED